VRTFTKEDQRSIRRLVLFVLIVCVAALTQMVCCHFPPLGGGGAHGIGGTVSATGGSTWTSPGGASGQPSAAPSLVVWPSCDPDPVQGFAAARHVVKHPLGPPRPAVRHLERRSFAAALNPLLSVLHPMAIPQALDQEKIGACVGFMVSHVWSTWPFLQQGTALLGLQIYAGATKRDSIDGQWPPFDTGSTGAAAMQEAVARGLFKNYRSASSFEELQALGQHGPCGIGINWTSDMWSPDRCGLVHPTGTIEGSHEPETIGWDYERSLVWLFNSWGNDWGVKLGGRGGYFAMTFADLRNRWDDSGEAECPEP
jgi:hypothetical protein